MATKIIEKGTAVWVCPRCNCKFSHTAEDICVTRTFVNPNLFTFAVDTKDIPYVVCPDCGKKIKI